MNEGICEFRFAICDWGRALPESNLAQRYLSLTPCFSGVYMRLDIRNRFSGFPRLRQTAEAVQDPQHRPGTLLKQGVNEKCVRIIPSFLRPRVVTGGILFEIANLKSKIP